MDGVNDRVHCGFCCLGGWFCLLVGFCCGFVVGGVGVWVCLYSLGVVRD